MLIAALQDRGLRAILDHLVSGALPCDYSQSRSRHLMYQYLDAVLSLAILQGEIYTFKDIF